MAYHKLIFPFALAVAITLVLNVEQSSGFGFFSKQKKVSHDFILGSRISGDRLVLQKVVHKSARKFHHISFKESFNTTRHCRITKVVAYDQKSNGKGGVVKLVKGGPGKQNVTLKFKSHRGYGIHFIVRVYGR